MIGERLAGLTTAHIADACVRMGTPVRSGPPGIVPIDIGWRVQGAVRPVRHFGSVDVFLEAIAAAEPGDVLVIDNGGRRDEACIGDLIAIEARAAGLAGLVVWGLHRDTAELLDVGLPVFSLGAIPGGPLRLDERDDDTFSTAMVGDVTVGRDDWVIGDADGVVFVARSQLDTLVDVGESIRDAEHRQAAAVREGRTLRDQLSFSEYLEKSAEDSTYTFRRHLREQGGAIET